MKVVVTVEVDTADGKGEIETLAQLLRVLGTARKNDETLPEAELDVAEEGEGREVDAEQVQRLKLLQEGLTEKQREVWQIFMNRPGAISASDLKNLLPHLSHPGALPGVFRAIHRWTNQLHGDKVKCPFNQVKWTGSEGIYRGLWREEVALLRHG